MFLFTGWQDSSAQQVDTTGNLVTNTPQGGPSSWTNGIYQDNLSCWAFGLFGYCGPNPIVRPGNNINFSYGETDLYQVKAISSVLPNTSGLRVNGFNFGFNAKNGNGWDDGRVDQLSAYVKFFDKQGSVVDNTIYNLTYKFNWTAFNFSKNFQTPLVTNNLSTVRYGFIGRDNNFWAGPYGPEINNINFQLKYSVDPCISNPMYSPTCPGYLSALNKLVPQPQLQPQASITTSSALIIEATPAPQVQMQQSTQTNVSVAANPLVQPVVTQQANSQAITPSQLQLALSIVSKNQERDKQLQQAAVQQALDIAKQAGDRALQVAQQVAQQSQQSQQQDLTVFNTAVQQAQQQTVQFIAQTPQQQQQTRQATIQTDQVQQQQTVVQKTSTPAVTSVPATLMIIKPSQQALVTQSAVQPILQPLQVTTTSPAVQQAYRPVVAEVLQTQPLLLEQAQQQQQVVLQKYKEPDTPQPLTQALQDRTNPISDLFYGLAFTPSTTSSMQELRKDVANNELAGGISLDRLSTQPIGYQKYMALAIQDAKFYQPREIYNRQTTVDNQRALRQLSSDRLHQEMVNKQYK